MRLTATIARMSMVATAAALVVARMTRTISKWTLTAGMISLLLSVVVAHVAISGTHTRPVASLSTETCGYVEIYSAGGLLASVDGNFGRSTSVVFVAA